MKKLLRLYLFFISVSAFSYARAQIQEDSVLLKKDRLRIQASIGYNIGGFIHGERFTYLGGLSGSLGIRKKLGKRVHFLGSVGIDQFDERRFFPILIGFDGLTSEKKTNFINFKLGYSFVTLAKSNVPLYYGANGGIHLELGLNKYFVLKKSLQLGLGLSLKHQAGMVNFIVLSGNTYKQRADISSFQFHMNLIL